MKIGGNQIALMRMKQGLTLRQLGAMADLSASSIAAIEKGVSLPRPGTAKRLCDALGVAFEDLFSIESDERGDNDYIAGRERS